MRLRLRDISIRSKLILMQVFTSVLVLSIVFTVFVITDINSYKERKEAGMKSLAKVTGNNVIPSLDFQNNEDAQSNLDELKLLYPEIVHAVILDTGGKYFAGFSKVKQDSAFIPQGMEERETKFIDDHLYVRENISDTSGKDFGEIYFDVELTELEDIKKSKYKLAVLLLFIAIGFSFLVAVIIQRYISRRLLKLVNTMKLVGNTGNYERPIHDDGRDEISTLIKVYNNLMERISESQQKKDEFIGIASHELKTPITSIKAYLELLKKMEDRQPNKQFVYKAWENVNKLVKLINDLLDVSKIQSGQLELNLQEFPIKEVLEEAIASQKMISGTHEIVMGNDPGDEIICADKQRIEQVLTNLLSNAIKYSPGENKVIVSTSKTDSEFIIRVRDYGVGVPLDEQESVFERFYRTKDISAHISGFGLGLYICNNIMKRHRGKIWVETEDKGSSFYFALPLRKNVEIKSEVPEFVESGQ